MFNFGQRLKHIREKMGLTQKQLAEKVGSDERTVRRYESGAQKPGLDVIFAIVNNLDIDANYLFGRTDDPTPPSKKP